MGETIEPTMNRQQRRAMERNLAKRASQLRTSQAEESAVRNREQSTLRRQAASPFQDQREVERGIALLERFDGMAGLRNGMRRIAHATNEWAGIPMPLDSHDLVIEPTYPRAEALMGVLRAPPPTQDGAPTTDYVKLRNSFWSFRYKCWAFIYEEAGKIKYGLAPTGNQCDKLIMTLGASDAWGIEQEKNAIDTLGTLLRHRQFKQYLLTGMFMERSARSGVHYLFRRLRPTVAMTTHGRRGLKEKDKDDVMRVLCSLCLHPIGYYAGTWAGSMTPTDDVIAHLMLMRGDEHLFWRRANQHAAWDPNAGISS